MSKFPQPNVKFKYHNDSELLSIRIANDGQSLITIADTLKYSDRQLPGFIGVNLITNKRREPTGFQTPTLNAGGKLGYPPLLLLRPHTHIQKNLPVNVLFKSLRRWEDEELGQVQVRITLFFNRYMTLKKSYTSRWYALKPSLLS